MQEVIDHFYHDRSAERQAERTQVRDLLSYLPSLIVLDPWPRFADASLESLPNGVYRVLLAHFSVQEFLTGPNIKQTTVKDFPINPESSHRYVSALCIKYLIATNTMAMRLQQRPLREYAWNCWHTHAVSLDIRASECEKRSALRLFPTVTYHCNVDKIPGHVLSHLTNNERMLLIDRLTQPYFYSEYHWHPIKAEPYGVDNPELSNLLFKASNANQEEHVIVCRVYLPPVQGSELRLEALGLSFQDVSRKIGGTLVVSSSYARSLLDSDPEGVVRINGIATKLAASFARRVRARARNSYSPVYLWIDEVNRSSEEVPRPLPRELKKCLFQKNEVAEIMLGEVCEWDRGMFGILWGLAVGLNPCGGFSHNAVQADRLTKLLLSRTPGVYRGLANMSSRLCQGMADICEGVKNSGEASTKYCVVFWSDPSLSVRTVLRLASRTEQIDALLRTLPLPTEKGMDP